MGGSRRGADLGMWTGVYIHDYAIKQPNFQYLNRFSSSRYIYCLLLPWKTKDSRFPLHYKPGVELRPLVGLAVLLCGLSLLWLPLSLQEPRKIFLTHPAHNKHPGWHFALTQMSQMAGVGWGQVPRVLNEGCGEKLPKSLMSPQVGAKLTCGLLELKAAAGGGTSPPSTKGDKPLSACEAPRWALASLTGTLVSAWHAVPFSALSHACPWGMAPDQVHLLQIATKAELIAFQGSRLLGKICHTKPLWQAPIKIRGTPWEGGGFPYWNSHHMRASFFFFMYLLYK